MAESRSISPGTDNGWLQHVFVQSEGNVIFSAARLWSRSLPSCGRKRKQEKARWRRDRGGLMLVIRWPVPLSLQPRSRPEEGGEGDGHSFLDPDEIGLSSRSVMISRSSIMAT